MAPCRLPASRSVALAQSYASSLEETEGFGVNSGVFVKFDGAIDTASLPPTADASRQPGASVFLLDIDAAARHVGEHIPLWIDFRTTGDQYRGPNLLVAMPVPGHPLEANALYALVLTDALCGGGPHGGGKPPFMQHMRAEQADGDFEQSSLPLYTQLWQYLEAHESLSREHVVGATVYRTGNPTRGMLVMADTVRAGYGDQLPTAVTFNKNGDNYWLVVGNIIAPQFQTGTPPFAKQQRLMKYRNIIAGAWQRRRARLKLRRNDIADHQPVVIAILVEGHRRGQLVAVTGAHGIGHHQHPTCGVAGAKHRCTDNVLA